MQEPRVLRPGVYLLNNQKGGTAADLSGGDRRSLIGFPVHSGTNQQWRFNPSGAGFSIQSVSDPDLYVSVSVAANPAWLTQAAQSSRLKPSRALRNDPAALVTSSQWYRRDPASKRLSHGLTAEFGWQRKPVVIIVPLATLDDDAIQSQAISFQSPPIYISDLRLALVQTVLHLEWSSIEVLEI
ncbi:hypothetical protein BDN71DRAFT_1511727 [Pleurotus eryngii]|uniref:Ricin B lectin domain-containing protein n=1 Tax=Pleurotus eryngii TaxID=5323 RepID=A0A9P5ZLE6_PLEER|nr:hypothetical protein BDN71DRAFT_1511727 [Pleurotus eryngii]